MLFVCIPVRDEAPTIGLVLWRVRKMFADFPREYELIVFNDGSSDATAEVLAPYAEALPVTILGGPEHVGYSRAIDALVPDGAGSLPVPAARRRHPHAG